MSDDGDNEPRVEEEEEEHDDEDYQPVSLEDIPDGPRTIVVGGFSSITTIAQAVEAVALPEDQILVLAGAYREDLVLSVPVTIIGDTTPPTAAVDPTAQQLPQDVNSAVIEGTLTVKEKVTGVKLNGITVIQGVVFEAQSEAKVTNCCIGHIRHVVNTHVAVFHAYAHATFETCSFGASDKCGLYCFPYSMPRFEKCAIMGRENSKNTCVGMLIDDANPYFNECEIAHFCMAAVMQQSCKKAVFNECHIHHMQKVGVLLSDGCCARFEETAFKFCGQEGMVVGAQCCPMLKRCVFVSNDVRLKKTSNASTFDNVLVTPSAVIDDDGTYAIRGFVAKAKDPTLRPKKPVVEEEEE